MSLITVIAHSSTAHPQHCVRPF